MCCSDDVMIVGAAPLHPHSISNANPDGKWLRGELFAAFSAIFRGQSLHK